MIAMGFGKGNMAMGIIENVKFEENTEVRGFESLVLCIKTHYVVYIDWYIAYLKLLYAVTGWLQVLSEFVPNDRVMTQLLV